MSLHKVYHRSSLLNVSSPPALNLLHHLPKSLSSSPSLSRKSARYPPIRSHLRPTVKSVKAMSASRFNNLVPINAVAAEGGSGSNGSLSSSSSSTAAAATTVDYEDSALDAGYRLPPQEIRDIVDAPPLPALSFSPHRDKILFLKRRSLPPLPELARPEEKLAGIRIDGNCNTRNRMSFYTGIGIHQLLDDGTLGPEKEVHGLPDGAKINFVTWSNDGRHLSFSVRVDEDNNSSKLRIWVAEVETGKARPLFQSPDIHLNAVFDNFVWVDNSTLLVCTIPLSRGDPPKKPLVPSGPKIQSNEQQNVVQVRTFQDLLKDEYDEDLFEYYATTQLVLSSLNGTVKPIGPPAIYTSMDPSPDHKYLLITSIHRPYSFIVPCGRFPKKVDVWTTDGKFVRELCDLPLAEDIPIAFNSVRKGMRSINWRADKPSTLYWAETQDGGDAKVEVCPRDIVYAQPAEPPEGEQPKILHRLDLRYGGISWCDDSLALVYESWYKTRRIRTWVISPGSEDVNPRILFDRSSEDVYSDPGSPMLRRTPAGTYVIAKVKKENDEGTCVLLNGSGATPNGNIPFLDLFDINTSCKERIWESEKEKYYESVVALMSDENEGDLDMNQLKILTSKESKTENTQYYIQSWPDKKACQITNFPHPYPQLAELQKEMVRYERKDGVQLTATLYLPPEYDPARDGPLPCLVWSYPGEFKSKDAAGQVRGSPNEFAGIGPTSALLWLARRFAILSGPTIPIIGEGDEEANDRYVEQLVASAEAAVEEVIRRGVAHPNKIAVGGHSYGAFMTANLLAHAPHLFCCGVARSGAYNRTLTPFGFQNEDRTLWEATTTYVEMSPFMSANKIKKPILLIHGEEDNNPGTLTMQSDRFFNALKGHGALSRLVILPFESHGYAARESIMHVLWETDRWLQKYCVPNTSDTKAELDACKDDVSKGTTDSESKAVGATGGGVLELTDLEHERFHSLQRSSL
ncbi:probable glutamyl endopeptidase, chloroplastic isoform X3 [Actinidia eriantha]|nr:probable glutamyl endopeptidase, chloroplastic isoform X2 [Actinidia eriantha]XP_057483831.1 probable glutamyl endopeptidase, chloroplastic isoform X3 [Actinidia eriantha]